jgi:predicted nucleic-acid-binding Zn-ribbon protein
VNCPKCNATEVYAAKRGWNLMTGFIGSSKIVFTCLECGHTFKPGEQHAAKNSGAQVIIIMVILGIALFILFVMTHC